MACSIPSFGGNLHVRVGRIQLSSQYINTIYNTNTNNRNRIVENTINALRNNNNRSYRNNRNILNENIINNYNNTNNNTTYNPERGGYPGINSANGIVGPNNTYTQTTNYPINDTNINVTIIFDRQIDPHTLLSSRIKCPFCRIECERTDWFNTNIKDTCDICCEDGDIYKFNLCRHKMCKHCVDNIRN